METPLLWAPKGDPRQPAPIRDNVVEIVVFSERIKRRVHFEEYLSVCCLRTTRFQVVDQGLADLVGQRQSQRRARLRVRDFYGRLCPTKVVQFQCADISHTQSQSVDRKSTRLNSSHQIISYAVFCLKT